MTDHDDTLHIHNQFKDADEIKPVVSKPFIGVEDVSQLPTWRSSENLREAICMHCAQTITITHSDGAYHFQHPRHSADPATKQWTMEVSDTVPQEELLVALGSFIRNTVHAGGPMPRPEDKTEPKKVEVKPSLPGPKFTHVQHHPHLQAIINEVLGPHIQAIAAVVHMTDIIGAGQELVITMTDECGFDGDIIIRVRSMGDDAQH